MLVLNCAYKSREINISSQNSHPVLISQNFGNFIHSFICWLKFHTKTSTMTSWHDFFMSSVLKKLSPILKVFFQKLDDTFREEISPLRLRIQKMKTEVFNLMKGLYESYRHGQLIIMVQKALTKTCAWSSLLKLLHNFLSYYFIFAPCLTMPGSNVNRAMTSNGN